MKGHLRRCFAIREEQGIFQPLLRSGADCRSALRAHVGPSTLRAQGFPPPCSWPSLNRLQLGFVGRILSRIVRPDV
jgi:hypothetical protein